MNYVLNMFDIIRLIVDTFSLPCTPLNSAQAPHHNFVFCALDQITTFSPACNLGPISQFWILFYCRELTWWLQFTRRSLPLVGDSL